MRNVGGVSGSTIELSLLAISVRFFFFFVLKYNNVTFSKTDSAAVAAALGFYTIRCEKDDTIHILRAPNVIAFYPSSLNDLSANHFL